MNFNPVGQILSLNCKKQRPEPFERAKVTTDPEEIHFAEPCLLPRIIHPIPNTLQDRRKRRHADARADKDGNFILEDILRGAAERSINVHPWKNPADSRIDVVTAGLLVHTDHRGCFTLLALAAGEVATQGLSQGAGKVAHAANVYGDVVLLRSTRQSERVVLPEGYLRTAQEDIL